MDIELLEKRQAVLSWRDELMLGIWRIANRAGIEAKFALETHLANAGIVDALWDPAAFTRDRVDGAIRAAMRGGLEGLFAAAAEELRAIDFDYSELADALLESLRDLRTPANALIVSTTAAVTAPAAQSATSGGRLGGLIASVSSRELIQNAREWGSWALEIAGEASEAARQKLQSGTGLHDRLRQAAQVRIDSQWTSTSGDNPSMVAQLMTAVETVANEARSMAR